MAGCRQLRRHRKVSEHRAYPDGGKQLGQHNWDGPISSLQAGDLQSLGATAAMGS